MHSSIAGEILERMAINIDVEYRYIFYLKELLRLEELAGDNYDYNLENFKINEFDEVHFSRRQRAKNVNGPKNRKKDNGKMVFTEIEDSQLNIKFYGNFWNRRDLRKEMLNNFRDQLHDYASYKQFLDDFLLHQFFPTSPFQARQISIQNLQPFFVSEMFKANNFKYDAGRKLIIQQF